ncbi:FAD-dependent oxidoreductase [Ramlibacter sp. AW1]|uniref:FAD-dependent oxidoreductase n=1 Tax=Ramlibacter aurantiacus TaxID=2801330 RepID=A0A937D6Q1_9BURK|nr:FAD-dependent oxidoreductase [Ramlibacter aurantiacus]MBL0420096.1 FAD-dependent oxidoreductase [Ramlibacter aurantiacus]
MQQTDVAVVGGGLAGLTAAAELARLGVKCTAFTGPAPGGLLLSIESVEGMPEHPEGIPGYDLCPMAQEAAMDAGAEFINDDASALQPDGDGWIVTSPEGSVRARAVVLAPGAHLRPLGVPGEERLAGKGVSHCASCDGPLLRGKPVAVVGGGDAACQEALTIAAHASEVHLISRGPLRARESWQQRVRAQPKIQVHEGARVTAIEGDNGVEAVTLADGRTLPVAGVFAYAGLLPNTGWLQGVVELDADGRIPVDGHMGSKQPGLFAAGFARSGNNGQAAEAEADGKAAAEAAHKYLNT